MPFNIETIAVALQKNGYYTGLIGKYINSWEARRDPNIIIGLHSSRERRIIRTLY
jgi:arylsulfatase A-like enzyme